MEYIAEKKPNSDLKRKVCSPSEVFKLKEVQEIKDAMQEHLIFIGLDRGNNVRKVNLLNFCKMTETGAAVRATSIPSANSHFGSNCFWN